MTLHDKVRTYALQHAWRNKRPLAYIVSYVIVTNEKDNLEYFVYMHDPRGHDYGLIINLRGVLKELDQQEARRMIKSLGSAS